MMKILITEPENYSPTAIALYRTIGEVDFGPLNRTQLKEKIGDYDVVIVRLGHRIDAEIIDSAQKLKFIITPTTGLNHVDIDYAQERGITTLSLKGERAFLDQIHATAEHNWGLLLALIRKTLPAAHDVLNGSWERSRFRGTELYGKKIGIVGLGRLGTKTAQYARTFGMIIYACDPNIDTRNSPATASPVPNGVTMTALDDLIRESDIISIHASYHPGTHGLIGQDQITKMKDGCLVLNTARGEIIDETALLHGLESGKIGGAALDVLCEENSGPPGWERSSPLIQYARTHDNLIITPHIGGATKESMEKTEVFMAEKLKITLQ